MKVKWKGFTSRMRGLIGGSGQGTLIGGPQYLVGSFDVANNVPEQDKFRYFDDLMMLELLMLASILQDYEIMQHIPNDVGVDQLFINPENFKMQTHLNEISLWSDKNK